MFLRISMYAAMGYIVPEYFKFPGELSPKLGLKFADIPNGLAAITKVWTDFYVFFLHVFVIVVMISVPMCCPVPACKVPGQGWAQIVAFLGTYELFINKPVPCLHSKGDTGYYRSLVTSRHIISRFEDLCFISYFCKCNSATCSC